MVPIGVLAGTHPRRTPVPGRRDCARPQGRGPHRGPAGTIAALSPASVSELRDRSGAGWWAGGPRPPLSVRAPRAGAIGGSRPSTSPPAGGRGASVFAHPSTSWRQCRPSPPTSTTRNVPEGRCSARPARAHDHRTSDAHAGGPWAAVGIVQECAPCASGRRVSGSAAPKRPAVRSAGAGKRRRPGHRRPAAR